MARTRFLHADLDAFYASVEQLLDPSLRGIPMAVGGGVVLAASYEARAFGVRSGMSVAVARRRCPPLTVVGGSFGRYREYADRVVAIFDRYTPEVERISIDEAFLYVSGSVRLFGNEEAIATRIRNDVRTEVGLPISVGIASTKHLAKVASAVAKPDGLCAVPVGGEVAFLHPLPVGALWGVGSVTGERLAAIGVRTVGELAATPPEQLVARIGPGAARHLLALAHNQDPRQVVAPRATGSVGSQSAFPATGDATFLDGVLIGLVDRVGRRLRAGGRMGRTVTVALRRPPRRVVSRASTVADAIAASAAILELARPLLADALAESEEPVTLVRVAVSHLEEEAPTQLEFDVDGGSVLRPGSRRGVVARDLDAQLDAIRDRYGRGAVRRASAGDDPGGIGDDFRELSERD